MIEVLNNEGRLSQHHLPIYGCRFEDRHHVALLRDYLLQLDIGHAKEVQLIADGAPWIWQQVSQMLKEIQVPKSKIVETLGYYHAVEHLHTLFDNLPSRIGKKQGVRIRERCKRWLWQGKIEHILRLWNILYQRKPKVVRTELNYFRKNQTRMNYDRCREGNLMCGSGVVESAIRRVINFRFKNTGTFWLADNVEPLYFLRGAVLSKRWSLLITNLAKRYL